jgi:hypothetical protein
MEYDYINTVQKKQVISREKYLPIFLNIFIVTGNQMLITSYGKAKKKNYVCLRSPDLP